MALPYKENEIKDLDDVMVDIVKNLRPDIFIEQILSEACTSPQNKVDIYNIWKEKNGKLRKDQEKAIRDTLDLNKEGVWLIFESNEINAM